MEPKRKMHMAKALDACGFAPQALAGVKSLHLAKWTPIN